MRLVKVCEFESISASYETTSNMIANSISLETGNIFIHLNIHNYLILKQYINQGDLLGERFKYIFEGVGMKAVNFIFNRTQTSDVNGTDLYPLLFDRLAREKRKVFLLGGESSVVIKTRNELIKKFQGIDIVGYKDGFFNLSEMEKIKNIVEEAKPDLIVIGMGMKKEIEFLIKSKQNFGNISVWCVGGLFDFIAGAKPRAPLPVRKLRLEWLFRTILDPGHKITRVVIEPFKFFISYFKFVSNRKKNTLKVL